MPNHDDDAKLKESLLVATTKWMERAAESTDECLTALAIAVRNEDVRARIAERLRQRQLFLGHDCSGPRSRRHVHLRFTYPPESIDPDGTSLRVLVDLDAHQVVGIENAETPWEPLVPRATTFALPSFTGVVPLPVLTHASLACPGDGGIAVDGQSITLVNGSGSRTVKLTPDTVDVYVVCFGPTATYSLSWSVTINGVTKTESPTRQGGGKFSRTYTYPFSDFNLATVSA